MTVLLRWELIELADIPPLDREQNTALLSWQQNLLGEWEHYRRCRMFPTLRSAQAHAFFWLKRAAARGGTAEIHIGRIDR